jgi:hypothetical protein
MPREWRLYCKRLRGTSCLHIQGRLLSQLKEEGPCNREVRLRLGQCVSQSEKMEGRSHLVNGDKRNKNSKEEGGSGGLH